MNSVFGTGPLEIIGCLSFEERSIAFPLRSWTEIGAASNLSLFELEDPTDGVPDYSKERSEKLERNRKELANTGVIWNPVVSTVMAGEETLISNLRSATESQRATVILDITAFPKRYFCFLLRRLMAASNIQNLIVTYTAAGSEGYTLGHLAEDVMSPDTLPGFAGSLKNDKSDLVVGVGFEALGLRSLIVSLEREVHRHLRIILPFPAPIETVRRQWETLRQITENEPRNLVRNNVAVIASWDAELVYQKLNFWKSADISTGFAPFGPKTHTLAMALFAIENDSSLWYTQPKVYHPDYTRGAGAIRWYAVKWRGIRCFDR